MLKVAAGRWGEGQPGPVGRLPVIAHEVWKNRPQYRHEPLRDRPPRAAVADDQCVDLEYVFRLARKHTHWVVLPSVDAPDALEGESAGQGVGVRQAQDLEPAVTHRLDKELRVLVDDHRPEVKLPALELDELLLDTLGLQDEVQLRERREHLACDVFGAAAD